MQPNIPKLIELVIKEGITNALAEDHDGFTDEQRLSFYTKQVMDALQTGFTFLEYETEDEYED